MVDKSVDLSRDEVCVGTLVFKIKTYFDCKCGVSMMARWRGRLNSFFPKCFSSIFLNFPVVASLSKWNGVTHPVCPLNVQWERNSKREKLSVSSHVNVYFWGCYKYSKEKKRKISCSIVMTQWSNLYLF